MANVSSNGSYFKLSKVLAARPDLSLPAKNAFAVLLDHRNPRTGQCNPKVSTVARELGIHRITAQRALDELRDAGLVTSKRGRYGCSYEFPDVANCYISAGPDVANRYFQMLQNATSGPSGPLVNLNQLKQGEESPLEERLRRKPMSKVMRIALEMENEKARKAGA